MTRAGIERNLRKTIAASRGASSFISKAAGASAGAVAGQPGVYAQMYSSPDPAIRETARKWAQEGWPS